MQHFHRLTDFPSPLPIPLTLSIGNFDGFHKGHQAIISQLVQSAKAIQGQSVALTFLNHPREVMQIGTHVPRLCSEEQKLRWFDQAGVDFLLLLPFTRTFSQQTPELFLHEIRQIIPFSQLILGHDAHIGRNRQGTPEVVKILAEKMGFSVTYLPPITLGSQAISSSRIRELINEGKLDRAAELIGRPYSIRGPVLEGAGHGKTLGFPTANIDVSRLCLPPKGVYAVTTEFQGRTLPAIANLGHAPTLQEERKCLLEVHIFDEHFELNSEELEVTPQHFIRPEIHFPDKESLKSQIQEDIQSAKRLLSITPNMSKK